MPPPRRYNRTDNQWGICQAYADRFGVTRRLIKTIGTLQLSLCRSDEARRLLIFGIEPKKTPGRRTTDVTLTPIARQSDVV